jgi:hypothetical protein
LADDAVKPFDFTEIGWQANGNAPFVHEVWLWQPASRRASPCF